MGVWSNYQCEGQLSIFDFIDNPENQSVAESSQSIIRKIEEREILKGSGFENGKTRIYNFFKEDHTEKECAEFLKKEYGQGGWSIDEGYCGHDASGIDIKFDKAIGKCSAVHNGWPMVVKKIRELIDKGKYKPNAPDVKTPAEVWAEETGYSDYWQHDIEFIDDKPVCTYSKHTCNRKELFKVAEMDNTIVCPHVCCRKCDEVMCGARCNGAELPKEKPLCSQAEECEAYPSGCGGTIEPCRFGGAYHWSNKSEETKKDVHIDRDGREHKPLHWMKYERCENCIQWKRSDRNEQPPAGWGVFGFCMEHKYKCVSTSYCNKFEDKRRRKNEI